MFILNIWIAICISSCLAVCCDNGNVYCPETSECCTDSNGRENCCPHLEDTLGATHAISSPKVCANGKCCPGEASKCCPDGKCCDSIDRICCPDGCCCPGTVCCPGSCCVEKYPSCCPQYSYCCPETHPICCMGLFGPTCCKLGCAVTGCKRSDNLRSDTYDESHGVEALNIKQHVMWKFKPDVKSHNRHAHRYVTLSDDACSGKLSDKSARETLFACGIGFDPTSHSAFWHRYNRGLSLEQIRSDVIDNICKFKKSSGCDVTVTEGTNQNHSGGGKTSKGRKTHWMGYKLDIKQPNECIRKYVIKSCTEIKCTNVRKPLINSKTGKCVKENHGKCIKEKCLKGT